MCASDMDVRADDSPMRRYVTNGAWLLGAAIVVGGVTLAAWQSPLFILVVPLGIWIAARSGTGEPLEPPPRPDQPGRATSAPGVSSHQPVLRPWIKVAIYAAAIAGALFFLYILVVTILFATSDFTF